ncbi:RteC domain-containing protein [Costertonia aggregata]|uniref:RteC domain-containing protein n=1 Tax=Costertonia aggregata TaxID=343403 RepID=A0A7H9AMW2_9FLAO|nr:RteC domain-containing protein [Costertonia aggregata]QLG44713.1 RteC domain-containing protein [Costertonia aggregata]
MQTSIKNILDEYKNEIEDVGLGNLEDFLVVEKGIQISRRCIQSLRVLLRNKEFDSPEDEIRFFKEQKPCVYTKIKFYSKLYQFLLRRPQGSLNKQRRFIDQEIEKLQEDIRENLDFVKYYREGSTYLDKYYFLRGKDEVKLITDTSYYLTDNEFSISHDNLVAEILAYDLLINHYQKLLSDLRFLRKNGLKAQKATSYHHKRSLKWTATKTDLIELLYALHTSGAIEDGQISIKQLAEACEELFELEFDNVYRTYLEIKGRKNDRTKFLDRLKTSLMVKIEKDEL